MAADADAARRELNNEVTASTSASAGPADDPPGEEQSPGKVTDVVTPTDAVNDDAGRDETGSGMVDRRDRVGRAAVILIVGIAVCTSALAGWLGWRAHETGSTEHQRSVFIAAARQGALSITTIDWQHADADVQHMLDSSTGTFYDDLLKRRGPFTDIIKATQSSSTGTIADAGLESQSGDEAQAVVIVSIKSSNRGVQDQGPRIWRLRMTVKNVDDKAKVSNVQFVQ